MKAQTARNPMGRGKFPTAPCTLKEDCDREPVVGR